MNWKKLIHLIVGLFLIYLVGITFITSHEATHYYIFARYNVESEMSFDFFPFPKGVVVPTGNYQNCNDYCKTQHALNDIIGYNLVVFMTFIFAFYIIIKK